MAFQLDLYNWLPFFAGPLVSAMKARCALWVRRNLRDGKQRFGGRENRWLDLQEDSTNTANISPFSIGKTVDGNQKSSELNQLRLVDEIPLFTRVLAPSQ